MEYCVTGQTVVRVSGIGIYRKWCVRNGRGGGGGVGGVSVILICVMVVRMQWRLPAFTHWIMSGRWQLMLRRMMVARRYRCTRRFICAVFGAVTRSKGGEAEANWRSYGRGSCEIWEGMDELPFGWICVILIGAQSGISVLVRHSKGWSIQWAQAWSRWRYEIAHTQAGHHSDLGTSWINEIVSNPMALSLTYLTKLAFRSQSLELIVLAERMDPLTNGSILLLSGR